MGEKKEQSKTLHEKLEDAFETLYHEVEEVHSVMDNGNALGAEEIMQVRQGLNKSLAALEEYAKLQGGGGESMISITVL